MLGFTSVITHSPGESSMCVAVKRTRMNVLTNYVLDRLILVFIQLIKVIEGGVKTTGNQSRDGNM